MKNERIDRELSNLGVSVQSMMKGGKHRVIFDLAQRQYIVGLLFGGIGTYLFLEHPKLVIPAILAWWLYGFVFQYRETKRLLKEYEDEKTES
jgi:hypothetical protein